MILIAEDHFYTLTRIHKKKQKDHRIKEITYV